VEILFLNKIHCSVYIINSLLAASCMCSWARTVARKSSIPLHLCRGALRSCRGHDIEFDKNSTNL